MLTKSKDFRENYCAVIVQLGEPIKHPNADKLQCFIVQGSKVITDLSYNKGDICCLFAIESKLNQELLSGLNMYDDKELNQDKVTRGYVNKHSRVRAVKLRGEPSMGLVLKVETISTILGGPGPIEIGMEFDTWNGKLICEKYVPVGRIHSNREAGPKRKAKYDRLVENQFRLHCDTTNLRKNIHQINPNDMISITTKLHGTSWVCGNVLTKRKLSVIDKVSRFFGASIKDTEYDIIYSSRSVIKNKYEPSNAGYYGTDLWGDIKACLDDKIPAGFTLYGECVGYTSTGREIQKDYSYGYESPVTLKSNPENKLSEVTLSINMDYEEGLHFGIYVYRITYTNQDGVCNELSWGQIKEYCNYYNIKYVPELYYGYAKDWSNIIYTGDRWHEEVLQALEKEYLDKECPMCTNKVPCEGIVIHKDNFRQFLAWKLKSYSFLERETKELDSENINIEDEQSIGEE